MSYQRKSRTFAADFETTVFDGQERTDVWASACSELFTDEVTLFHSINEQFEYLVSLKSNLVVYFHNLKFDGAFWLDFLMKELEFKQAYIIDSKDNVRWLDDYDMKNKTFKYSISDRGMWYNFKIKYRGYIIELRDSYKLLPFKLKHIGKDFQTKHQKLEMEYKGVRFPGCKITDEEVQYIKNDVLVLKEALEIMYTEGHNKLTIGACCMSEFKKLTYNFEKFFPNLYDVALDSSYGSPNAGEYIRKSYKGGWCYLVPEKSSKIFNKGLTADVNSLYPSEMHSESGNRYPIGLPKFWKGEIPDFVLYENLNLYFFVRFKCRFKIKPGFLPFIQIKNSFLYLGTECLTTSDIKGDDGKYHSFYERNGEIIPATVELTLTKTDYILMLEHYDVYDMEVIDGAYFETEIGIFDGYINKYRKIKMESKGAKRTLAKLFLNNLYGKFASSTDSSFKLAYLKDDDTISFRYIEEHEKKPGYIAVGSAITSYSRNFTIRAAQSNYYGADKPGFIYADTDSVHCDLSIEELKGMPIHEHEFCHWKIESQWDKGYFTRQKTYIEIINNEIDIKCAGMPDRCKELFISSVTGTPPKFVVNDYEEKIFINERRTIEHFNIGLTVPGKLMPKRIPGGILLTPTTFEMR